MVLSAFMATRSTCILQPSASAPLVMLPERYVVRIYSQQVHLHATAAFCISTLCCQKDLITQQINS